MISTYINTFFQITTTMLYPLLLLLIVSICNAMAKVSEEKVLLFNKCCPKFQSVIKVIEGEEERYDCIGRNNPFNITVNHLVTGENLLVEVGFPADCEAEEEYFDHRNYSFVDRSKTCYDKIVFEVINGTVKNIIPQVLAFKCSFERLEVPTEKLLTHVKKCCPITQSYDLTIHSCRDDSDNIIEEWLISRLYQESSNLFDIDYNVHCKNYEYAMEMSEQKFSLVADGSELMVSRLKGKDRRIFVRGEWCVDRAFRTNQLVARGCSRDCNQIGSFCLKKCCPVGEHYQPRRCGSKISDCVSNNDETFQLNYTILFEKSLKAAYTLDVVGIRSKLICPKGKFVLNRTNPADKHYLLPSGALALPVMLGKEPTDGYCVENFDNRPCGGNVSLETLTCFLETIHRKDFSISFVAISISCVFLALTLLVYLGVAELRNLHGKTLLCHVGTMLLAFCCLARVQYDRVENGAVCKLLGYGIYFGFVAAFSWLNVMCLDIWWTFGSIRSIQPLRKAGAERRRFAWYSLYAWSVAGLLTAATFLLDTYPVASVLDSNMGNGICWFAATQNGQSDWPHYIFFVFPMGIVTCVNFVLWVLTARHCNRVKSEMHRLQAGSAGDRAQKRFRADKARYLLTGKLWVVMGAGWVWEILSTVVTEPPWLWAACDLVNELQGVSIFLILVLKPKLYYLIRKKLGCSRRRMKTRLEGAAGQKSGNSSSSTGRTSSTLLPRPVSSDRSDRSDERAQLRHSHHSAVKLKP